MEWDSPLHICLMEISGISVDRLKVQRERNMHFAVLGDFFVNLTEIYIYTKRTKSHVKTEEDYFSSKFEHIHLSL